MNGLPAILEVIIRAFSGHEKEYLHIAPSAFCCSGVRPKAILSNQQGKEKTAVLQ
jgi:hypothetical protein